MDLALFDFDGTITTKETYTGFVKVAFSRRRKIMGGACLGPVLIGYRYRWISDHVVRPAVSRVGFWGDDPARVRHVGEQYARDVLPDLIRPKAEERLMWHHARGDRVVVVSASLDAYLHPWCRARGIDVICTELEVKGGRLTGRYVDGDCVGREKARRINARYTLAAHETVYAYGDTEDDRDMLALAHRKFFRWTEVQDVPAASIVTRACHTGE
jgi:HAD superfamily hydrolase (TIGR01490 family)